MLLLICGGSCSGKSTFARQFSHATVLSTDQFYLGKSKMQPPYNFDEPSSVDLELLYNAVQTLQHGGAAEVPVFSSLSQERVGAVMAYPNQLLIVEGIFAFSHPKLRELATLKIYLDVPREVRLARRIERDVVKGRSAKESIVYSQNVEAMHDMYVEPMAIYADIRLQ